MTAPSRPDRLRQRDAGITADGHRRIDPHTARRSSSREAQECWTGHSSDHLVPRPVIIHNLDPLSQRTAVLAVMPRACARSGASTRAARCSSSCPSRSGRKAECAQTDYGPGVAEWLTCLRAGEEPTAGGDCGSGVRETAVLEVLDRELVEDRGEVDLGLAELEVDLGVCVVVVAPVSYGPGLVARLRALGIARVDLALDVAGAGSLDELVTINGEAATVVTLADFTGPGRGVRLSRSQYAGEADWLPRTRPCRRALPPRTLPRSRAGGLPRCTGRRGSRSRRSGPRQGKIVLDLAGLPGAG